MGVFFGTDGIRGIVNHDLSYDICYRCGNALAKKYDTTKGGRLYNAVKPLLHDKKGK